MGAIIFGKLYIIFYNPTPRIALFVRLSVTEKDRIVLANAYTMQTSSPMYVAVNPTPRIALSVRYQKVPHRTRCFFSLVPP